MIWIKGCPRCHGELHDDRDGYGYYINCIQCGYYLSDDEIAHFGGLMSKEAEITQRSPKDPSPLPQESSTVALPIE